MFIHFFRDTLRRPKKRGGRRRRQVATYYNNLTFEVVDAVGSGSSILGKRWDPDRSRRFRYPAPGGLWIDGSNIFISRFKESRFTWTIKVALFYWVSFSDLKTFLASSWQIMAMKHNNCVCVCSQQRPYSVGEAYEGPILLAVVIG